MERRERGRRERERRRRKRTNERKVYWTRPSKKKKERKGERESYSPYKEHQPARLEPDPIFGPQRQAEIRRVIKNLIWWGPLLRWLHMSDTCFATWVAHHDHEHIIMFSFFSPSSEFISLRSAQAKSIFGFLLKLSLLLLLVLSPNGHSLICDFILCVIS